MSQPIGDDFETMKSSQTNTGGYSSPEDIFDFNCIILVYSVPVLLFSFSISFLFKILFTYLTEREREITSWQRGRQRVRGKQAPS